MLHQLFPTLMTFTRYMVDFKQSNDPSYISDTPPTDVKVTVICSQDADHPLMFVEWKVILICIQKSPMMTVHIPRL